MDQPPRSVVSCRAAAHLDDPPLKLGLVGLDTSHVTAFTQLLHDTNAHGHVTGARVKCAWPGGSGDWSMSRDRVDRFTSVLRDQFGVAMMASPEAVAEACDILMIESVDGRVHRDLLERTLPFGRPTFVDKPLALSVDDAREMIEMADRSGVALMSSSALRYAAPLQDALADGRGGQILGIDVHGPLAFEGTQPGYFWYGIHCIEMIVAALGVGCQEVRASRHGAHDVVIATWEGGRVATFHGLHNKQAHFGGALHRQRAVQPFDASASDPPFYACLLRAILNCLPRQRSDVTGEEMLEVVRVIEAANSSQRFGGAVALR